MTLISKEDGLNVNGDINFSGGNIIIISSGDLDAKPIEHDGLFQINGGNIIAAGISRTLGLNINTTIPLLIMSFFIFTKKPQYTGSKKIYLRRAAALMGIFGD